VLPMAQDHDVDATMLASWVRCTQPLCHGDDMLPLLTVYLVAQPAAARCLCVAREGSVVGSIFHMVHLGMLSDFD
jgi:hypothetical protein